MTRARDLESDFDAADESPGFLLWQITNRWQAAQRAALKPLGLTHVQFVLLASLTWLRTDGMVNQRDLAEHASIDPMMTSQVIRTLESRGLVERTEDPSDKRAWSLSVTNTGMRLANRAIVVVEDCDRAFFEALEDIPGFVRSLQLLIAGR
ncbi:MAG: MarR family transcriptional regulator [Acidimicrobiaceae bacterium]|nr:MarR family transcriptional regulator [Acidimicrobiaceae bacterium]